MKAHIEKEYKMMLTKKDYDYLTHNLDLTTHTQINYYYLSGKEKSALRIREIDSKFIFTLKIKENDYHKEYEFPIEENSLDNSKIKELLKEFDITNPEYIGKMETVRSIKKLKYGELCIDHSTYLGVSDYEIEYELYDYLVDENKEFMDILTSANLVYIKSPYTKFKRFLIQKSIKEQQ